MTGRSPRARPLSSNLQEQTIIHTRTLAVLALVGALALSGCTRKDPGPGSTVTDNPTAASPTTTAPADPMHTTPDEARNAYLHYVDVRNEVGQNYFREWETKYLPLTGGEEMAPISRGVHSRIEEGYRREGATVVVSTPDIVLYDDSDPLGHYRAEMRACVDTSRSQAVAEGRLPIRPIPDGRFYFEIVMTRAPLDADGTLRPDPYGQGWWRVESEHGYSEQAC